MVRLQERILDGVLSRVELGTAVEAAHELLALDERSVSHLGLASGAANDLRLAGAGEGLSRDELTAILVRCTDPGGTRGLDGYIARDFTRNIGAEIMGRNKFGPARGPWPDHEWQGWWGGEPPIRTPVFVPDKQETKFNESAGGSAESVRPGATVLAETHLSRQRLAVSGEGAVTVADAVQPSSVPESAGHVRGGRSLG